jgi:hypothetical protein
MTVSHRRDPLELVHAQHLDEAVQRLDRAVAEVRRCADVAPEPALRSVDEMIEDIYRTAADIRLDLIYSATIGSDLRKRWSNRMGEINLRAPTAPAEIKALLAELALHQTNASGALDFAVGQVTQALRRLRGLCMRYTATTQAQAN